MTTSSIEEEWKIIEDFPKYAVSNKGRVKRLLSSSGKSRNNILKPQMNRDPYPTVSLSKPEKKRCPIRIHKLVSRSFLGECPPGCEINHKDGNKRNPDAGNLQYVTRSQNRKHAYDIGLIPRKFSQTKLTPLIVLEIKVLLQIGYSGRKIAKIYSLHPSTISNIAMGRRWKHINPNLSWHTGYA